jgi:heat shock protein HslJ
LLLVLVVLFAVSGAVPAAAATSVPLRHTNWALRGSSSVNAVFDVNRVEGQNACNSYGAPYTVHGSRMTIGPEVSGTRAECPDIDPTYEAQLVKVASFRIRGTTLTLRDRAGRQLLVYRASIGKQALRGGWNATSYYTGTAVQSVGIGDNLTLEFVGARISGNGGCNTFDGPYTVRDVDRIHIGPLQSTLKACADPALNDQETQYLAALQHAVRYRVTGSTLTLFRPGDTIAATFERAMGLTSGT